MASQYSILKLNHLALKREKNKKYAAESRIKTNDMLRSIRDTVLTLEKTQNKILQELSELRNLTFKSSIIESFDESYLEHKEYIDSVNAMLMSSTNHSDNTFEPTLTQDHIDQLQSLDLKDFERFHSIQQSVHETGTWREPIHVE